MDLIEKMNDNELYELAEFILYLRNMNDPFNLNSIRDAIKAIKEKNIK